MNDLSELTSCLECEISSNCFKKLIPSELEFINHNKTQIHYKTDENICKQGAFASYVLYIADGLVKIYLESPGSKNINIKLSKTSEFVGLSAIFGNNIYNYSALALRDSRICLIEKSSFKKLLINNGNFSSEVIKWYCESEKHLFSKMRSMGCKQMHGRLADILIYLCADEFSSEDIFSYIGRKDIADFSCMSTESAVRILAEFKNDGIIEMNGKKIRILNDHLLKQISRRG
jgi:CRP/FNR family transcriptional regulator